MTREIETLSDGCVRVSLAFPFQMIFYFFLSLVVSLSLSSYFSLFSFTVHLYFYHCFFCRVKRLYLFIVFSLRALSNQSEKQEKTIFQAVIIEYSRRKKLHSVWSFSCFLPFTGLFEKATIFVLCMVHDFIRCSGWWRFVIFLIDRNAFTQLLE